MVVALAEAWLVAGRLDKRELKQFDRDLFYVFDGRGLSFMFG
jgi:hypothetical protein